MLFKLQMPPLLEPSPSKIEDEKNTKIFKDLITSEESTVFLTDKEKEQGKILTFNSRGQELDENSTDEEDNVDFYPFSIPLNQTPYIKVDLTKVKKRKSKQPALIKFLNENKSSSARISSQAQKEKCIY